MKKQVNRVAIAFFSLYAKIRGYKFSLVTTPEQNSDADNIFKSEGYKLPQDLEKDMEPYKRNTIKFIAYYKNKPVGTVGLANPKIANRPFDLHGVDSKGEHFEIQSLIVSKKHRECSQLVLLGLFKEMYMYSVVHSIKSWISFGMRQLYMTMRRYNKKINLVDLNNNIIEKPLAMYLYNHHVFDSYSIMTVDDFDPGLILKKFIKKRVKKMKQNFSLFSQ